MAQRPGGAARRAGLVLVAAAAVAATGACGAPTSGAGTPVAGSVAGSPVAGASVAGVPAEAAASGPTTAAGDCSAFSLSLVSDRGGRPSPVAAAEWFSAHGGVPGVPPDGWRPVGTDDAGATVRSGVMTLHVVRGPDGTWQVDSGEWC